MPTLKQQDTHFLGAQKEATLVLFSCGVSKSPLGIKGGLEAYGKSPHWDFDLEIKSTFEP